MRAVQRSWGHSSRPRRARPGEIRYTCVQTTWAVHVPGTLTAPYALFRQEGAHAGRCCLCGYLICLPLFRLLLSSVGTAFGRAERPIVAVLPRGLSRRAVRRGVGLRGALRLP